LLCLVVNFISTGSFAQNGNSNIQIPWKLNGNNADTTKFLGTTNNVDLVFKSNNVEGFRLNPSAEARFMGDVYLDKFKEVPPFNPGQSQEERLLSINSVGQIALSSLTLAVDDMFVCSPANIAPWIHANGTNSDDDILLCPNYKSVTINGDFTVGGLTFLKTTGIGIIPDNQYQLNIRSVGKEAGINLFTVPSTTTSTPKYSFKNTVNNDDIIAYSVTNGITNSDVFVVKGNGSVGIGTDNPAVELDVNGNVVIEGVLDICPNNVGNVTSGLGEQWTSNDWNVRIKSPMNSAWVTTTPIPQGHSYQGSYMGIGMTSEGFYFMHSYSPPGHVLNPVRYPFIVKNSGLVIAREIKVSLTEGGNWPDYVFHKEYNLEPLCEVEKYIKKNKHLFGMPSGKEVKENGINLGAMNVLLLQKIEELTLYIIELEKRINKLER